MPKTLKMYKTHTIKAIHKFCEMADRHRASTKTGKKKTIANNSLWEILTFKTPLPVFRTGISYNVFACRAGVVEWFHWKILYHPSQRQNEPVQNMPATD